MGGYIGSGPTRFNTADELTVTGDAQIDGNTLVVDSTNNRVGVNNASPSTALDVTGTVNATAYTGDGSSLTGVTSDVVDDTTPQLGGDLDVNGNAITGSTVAINGSNGEFMISATENGPVALRYDNNLKLSTKSDGVDVTGELQADSLDIDGDGDISGNLTLGGNLNLGDNDKAQFGAGNDLQIYHDGSNSYIDDTGAGDMLIRGSARILLRKAGTTENMIRAEADSYVKLYYDNAEKLATTSTGVDVTGTVTMDGGSTSADFSFGDNDKALFGAGNDLQVYHDGSNSYILENGTGNLIVKGSAGIYLSCIYRKYHHWFVHC